MYAPRRTAHGGDQAYNWPTLARYANLLIASGYDEHSASGPPGPITTAAGFGQMLDYAARVSRWRVAPAIGAFGYSGRPAVAPANCYPRSPPTVCASRRAPACKVRKAITSSPPAGGSSTTRPGPRLSSRTRRPRRRDALVGVVLTRPRTRLFLESRHDRPAGRQLVRRAAARPGPGRHRQSHARNGLSGSPPTGSALSRESGFRAPGRYIKALRRTLRVSSRLPGRPGADGNTYCKTVPQHSRNNPCGLRGGR